MAEERTHLRRTVRISSSHEGTDGQATSSEISDVFLRLERRSEEIDRTQVQSLVESIVQVSSDECMMAEEWVETLTQDLTQGSAERKVGSHISVHGKEEPRDMIIYHHEEPKDPPRPGYHRIVKTYDDLIPIVWADVPDGEDDPSPMYLSTKAARLMMMSDEEFERECARSEREDGLAKYGDNPEEEEEEGVMERRRRYERYFRVLVSDVAIGIAATLLFAPNMLALSPMDPNIAKAAVAVASGVGLAGTAVVANASLIESDERKTRLLPVSDQGGQEEPSVSDITAALAPLERDAHVGAYVRDALRQLQEAQRKQERIGGLIDGTFDEGSLSWVRFSGTLSEVVSTISRNAAMLANRVQTFDGKAYAKNKALVMSGEYRWDDIPDDIQESRHRLYEGELDSVRKSIEDNEHLLLELDRFEVELSSLETGGLDEDVEDTLDELRRATDEMRFYR